MACDEILHDLQILCFDQGLEIDRAAAAALFGKIALLIENISHATTHARSGISATRSQHKHGSLRQPLGAVVATAVDNGGSTGVAHGKAFSSDSVEKSLAAGCPVKRNISDQNIFFGGKSRSARRIDDQAPARQPFADVVIGFAFQRERNAVGKKRTQALSSRAG